MGRRASRDIAMKLLYQLEIQKEDKEEQIDITLAQNDLSKNDRNYVLDVVKGVFENLSYIDKVIDKYSKGWKINRISKVDLSILRLSIYEIGFMNDIPFSVSVNEAVELAKKYSNEDAGSFVNGILGKVSKARILPLESSDEEV
ncbi:MAG: transcription antitermination factor NusB [Clostridia bacterium]|jgi:N utilization substance protein B